MNTTPRTLTALMGATLLAAGCATAPGSADMGVKGATPATVSANQAMNQTVATFNPRDFEDATRGKLAELSDPLIKAPDGRVVWDARAMDCQLSSCGRPETLVSRSSNRISPESRK